MFLNLIVDLIIGAIVGWVASMLMGGKTNLVRCVVIGLIGGFVGGRSDQSRALRCDRSDRRLCRRLDYAPARLPCGYALGAVPGCAWRLLPGALV